MDGFVLEAGSCVSYMEPTMSLLDSLTSLDKLFVFGIWVYNEYKAPATTNTHMCSSKSSAALAHFTGRPNSHCVFHYLIIKN